MPGLIDTHAHAGHTLTKGLGSDSEAWMMRHHHGRPAARRRA